METPKPMEETKPSAPEAAVAVPAPPIASPQAVEQSCSEGELGSQITNDGRDPGELLSEVSCARPSAMDVVARTHSRRRWLRCGGRSP
jgi:hypothetical protein